jgi:hypothetical protein
MYLQCVGYDKHRADEGCNRSSTNAGRLHLSASQRLAKSCRRSIFFGAEPPIEPLQPLIAPASRQVINSIVTDGPQRQLGLDRAPRRHGAVDAEQLVAYPVLIAGLTTDTNKSRTVEIPSSKLARFCKASFPQLALVLACVSFLRRETARCGRFEPDCPSFANEPRIERCVLALDPTNPDPPVPGRRIRPFVVAANGAISNMRDQSISRRDPARPDLAALIKARLINFGGIDAVQPIDRAIQSERIAVSHGNVGRQAWPGHRQQQRCNENAHVARFS